MTERSGDRSDPTPPPSVELPVARALPTTELEAAATSAPRPLAFEVALVVLIAAAVFVPGIWKYSLVDPWETHYGEVSRAMLQNNDFVQTNWPGTSSGSPGDHEGFRSKPVFAFWMMAAGLTAVGVGDDGGYSGEMTDSARVMIGIRLPFICAAIFGLVMMWWALARLVSRRLAWLALLVVGSAPMFAMIGRNAIPDMPMVACTMGALAMFLMAVEDGDRPIRRRHVTVLGRVIHYDARHIVFALAGGFVVLQAAYYAIYFTTAPQLGIRGRIPNPAIWLPLLMLWTLSGLHRDGWLLCLWRLPSVLIGGVIAAIVNEPMPQRRPEQSMWRHLCDDILRPWERHALDRYFVRVLPAGLLVLIVVANFVTYVPLFASVLGIVASLALGVIWGEILMREGWAGTDRLADRILAMSPITTMRQLFMIGCYFLLAVSLLAKGPPGFAVIALVMSFHVLCFWRWRKLWEGGFEIKRGILLMAVVALPWHIGMWLKEGVRFIQEYWQTHILNRAGPGVDNSPGTFEYYTDQLGHGMWLWAALLPAALAAAMLRANRETREGRVRFMLALWAICAVALFCLVGTKFHHYILPAIPPLCLLVAMFLDDLVAGRERLHPLYAALACGIVLLVTRDLMFEPERWIEMFVFRYDRPWPNNEPYSVDTSDPILVLGLVSVVAIVAAATPMRRLGVAMIGVAGLAICVWALQVYMPIAGTHWGMRDAVRTYYSQRTIYGEKIVYFGERQADAALQLATDKHTFETFIPDTLQIGQPMTITVQVNKPADERIVEHEIGMLGEVTAIGDHSVEVTLLPHERLKLAPIFERAKQQITQAAAFERQVETLGAKLDATDDPNAKQQLQAQLDEARRSLANVSLSNKRVLRAVDADRLVAWQLYWRGEQFWSGGEIWMYSPSQALPEMKTSFVNTNNVEFQKYINDRNRTPLGRRYFIITEASRISSVRSMLPTPRARDSYEVLNTTSNKFSIAAFWL